jgi:hypothetical protein
MDITEIQLEMALNAKNQTENKDKFFELYEEFGFACEIHAYSMAKYILDNNIQIEPNMVFHIIDDEIDEIDENLNSLYNELVLEYISDTRDRTLISYYFEFRKENPFQIVN